MDYCLAGDDGTAAIWHGRGLDDDSASTITATSRLVPGLTLRKGPTVLGRDLGFILSGWVLALGL